MDMALPTGCHSSFLGLGTRHDIPAIDPACLTTGFCRGKLSETAGGWRRQLSLHLVPEFCLLDEGPGASASLLPSSGHWPELLSLPLTGLLGVSGPVAQQLPASFGLVALLSHPSLFLHLIT